MEALLSGRMPSRRKSDGPRRKLAPHELERLCAPGLRFRRPFEAHSSFLTGAVGPLELDGGVGEAAGIGTAPRVEGEANQDRPNSSTAATAGLSATKLSQVS